MYLNFGSIIFSYMWLFLKAMYRHAMSLGLQDEYQEGNGIVKQIVRMTTAIVLLHPLQAAQGLQVNYNFIYNFITLRST